MRAWVVIGLGIALAGCAMTAEQIVAEDASICGAWAPVGSMGYADCLEKRADQRAADRIASADRWRALGEGMARTGATTNQAPVQQTLSPLSPNSLSSGVKTTCYARGEYASGMNRICNYDCLGSAAAITVSAASLCPLTIRQ